MKTKQMNNNIMCSFLNLKNLSKTSLKHRKLKKKKKKKMDNDLIGKVRRTTTISDLPEEVLTQILIRVSATDILACVYVQKSWCSLITTRMFMNLHSNYHHKISSNSNNKYLLFWNSHTNAYEIRVDDIQCEKYLTLKFPAHLSDHFDYQLLSNGLICLFNLRLTTTHKDIYLWNPVIRKCITLPDSPHPPYSYKYGRWRAIAFGFVPEINDYLVVYMVKYTDSIITCVYSLNTNSWKQIIHNIIYVQDVCQSQCIFVNGIAIWMGLNSYSDRILVCFDTKTEMLREILSPESVCTPVIHAFDQSVYFFKKGNNVENLVMWVLKGDPMNEFVWQKKMMVRIRESPFYVRVVGLRNNGEPIICNAHDLISYNLDSHTSYDLVKSRDSRMPFCFWNNDPTSMIKPFVESLGLLDIVSTKY